MTKYLWPFITFLIGVALTLAIISKPFLSDVAHVLDQRAVHHQFVIAQADTLIGFNLVDPGQAPSNIKESVARGYRILMATPFYAPNYARDQLSCTNCHFSEGDTLGGKNNGFSLVGATTLYPRYSHRAGKVITLAERINYCFERSLNGKPLPLDSQEMQDIINYIKWISKEVEHIKNIPWLGITPLTSQHQPDPEQGRKIYQASCAACHQEDGQGGGALPVIEKTIPPLWGPNSFNDGAGMSRLSTLAAFIYWNMPYQDLSLTEDQALDVAAFVLEHPRDHFIGKRFK